LIQFYDAELAQLEEWWFPLQVLNKADDSPGLQPYASIHNDNQLIQMILDTGTTLAKIYARNLVLLVLDRIPFSRLENASNFFKLSASQHLSAIEIFNSPRLSLQDILHNLEIEDDQCPALRMNRLTHKLRNFIQDSSNSERVRIILFHLIYLSSKHCMSNFIYILPDAVV
jgi:hypothetical protein